MNEMDFLTLDMLKKAQDFWKQKPKRNAFHEAGRNIRTRDDLHAFYQMAESNRREAILREYAQGIMNRCFGKDEAVALARLGGRK